MSKIYLTPQGAKSRWKTSPDTKKVVGLMLAAEWTITINSSGHGQARCPHGHPEAPRRGIFISGTPKDDGNHANRLRDQLAKCPERHAHMR